MLQMISEMVLGLEEFNSNLGSTTSNRFPASCACHTTSTRTKSSGQVDEHPMFTSHK